MKKILVIYTGGTIGMYYNRLGVLKVKRGFLQSQLNTLSIINTTIELKEYDKIIDSSDVNISFWQQLISDIQELYYQYDGFIILHGTDTMAYTASVLSFALCGISKPIIITGSQLPLIHKRSDGWGNITDALYASIQGDLHEVALVFNHKMFRACRVKKISTNNYSGFNTPDREILADFGLNINWRKLLWRKATGFSFSPITPKNKKIITFYLTPGQQIEFIANAVMEQSFDAVILQTYGSGTVPYSNHKLIKALTHLLETNTLTVNISQVLDGVVSDEALYGNSDLKKFGVISGYNMTIEATFAKILILLSSNMDVATIKETISKNTIGEITEFDNTSQ